MRIVIVLCTLPGYCMLSVILSLCAQRCCGCQVQYRTEHTASFAAQIIPNWVYLLLAPRVITGSLNRSLVK